jgi:hypothetical protein
VIHGPDLGFVAGPIHHGPSVLLGASAGLAFREDDMIWIGIAWLASLAIVLELVYRAEVIEPDAEL